jgi:MFS family permease
MPRVGRSMKATRARRRPPASARSRFALNAVNFFLAELSGIGSPYLSDLLHNRGWPEGAIGAAAAMPGLGVVLVLPAVGYYLDRTRHGRAFLITAALVVGSCYVALPSLLGGPHFAVYLTFFVSGLAQAFFAPLLAGLALGLVGHDHLDRTVGSNQAWNHLGDVTAALAALFVVARHGIDHVFYLVGVIAALAAASAALIRRREIDCERASGGVEQRCRFRAVLRDRRVLVLVTSTALFQTAYASMFPFVVLRFRELGGSDTAVALIVLVSQASMAPVAVVAGRLLQRGRHKPVFSVGFVTLPFYIVACALARSPVTLVALQALGSVSAGIFGVAIVTFSADLTRGTGRFQALTGTSNAAFACGSVVGPMATGLLVEHAGYELAFFALAAVAAAAALLFIREMPETARCRRGAAPSP